MSKLQAQDEIVVNAPLRDVWAVITDIKMLPRINPGVVKASGSMNKQGEVRVCDVDFGKRKGTITERLIEMIPGRSTVWRHEKDNMGMTKMMKETSYRFELEELGDNKTKIISQSFYKPANPVVAIMNPLMMKRMFSKAQRQILQNIKTLVEK